MMTTTDNTNNSVNIMTVADDLSSNNATDRANLFPKYLMKLLNDEVAPEALWWLPDGKAFALCPDKIPSQILDKYFQKTKYSSFIRRLHNEGYRRQTRKYKKVAGVTLAEGTVVLSHALFQRDAPELLKNFYKKNTGGMSMEAKITAVPPSSRSLDLVKANDNQKVKTSALLAAASGSTNLKARMLEETTTAPFSSAASLLKPEAAILGLTGNHNNGTFPGCVAASVGAAKPLLSLPLQSQVSNISNLAQSLTALREARQGAAAGVLFGGGDAATVGPQQQLADDSALNIARLQQFQQQYNNSAVVVASGGAGEGLLSRSSSAESVAAKRHQRLSRNSSGEASVQVPFSSSGAASSSGSSSTNVTASSSNNTPNGTADAAALLDSQLRLQQLRWENSRLQLEEQGKRLSAIQALRRAAYWPH